jgi:hypothetical protein
MINGDFTIGVTYFADNAHVRRRFLRKGKSAGA